MVVYKTVCSLFKYSFTFPITKLHQLYYYQLSAMAFLHSNKFIATTSSVRKPFFTDAIYTCIAQSNFDFLETKVYWQWQKLNAMLLHIHIFYMEFSKWISYRCVIWSYDESLNGSKNLVSSTVSWLESVTLSSTLKVVFSSYTSMVGDSEQSLWNFDVEFCQLHFEYSFCHYNHIC